LKIWPLAEKYDLETLREEIIAAISRYQVSDENVLEVAILAEEKNLHQPLSEALYNVAAVARRVL
jgi:septum formation topological specificity factor MinE